MTTYLERVCQKLGERVEDLGAPKNRREARALVFAHTRFTGGRAPQGISKRVKYRRAS